MTEKPGPIPGFFTGNVGKFEGNFSSETVRKAALILAIICSIFAAAGATLKWIAFPGGALFLILGVGIFSLFALPLQMTFNFRRNKNGLRRTADVIGWFGIWFLLFGILYKAQSWPGAYVIMIGGAALTTVFCLLFFLASRKPEVVTNWWSGFTLCTLIMLSSVSIAWLDKKGDGKMYTEQYTVYQGVLDNCKSKIQAVRDGVGRLNLIESKTESENAALIIAVQGMELINYIDKVKTEVVAYSNTRGTISDESTDIRYPLDIDYTTLYLVGPEPEMPTGRALDVYDELLYFKESVIDGIEFSVPVTNDPVAREQWVKDNFYHASVLESLTRLTKLQTAIAESILAAMETKDF